MSGKGKPINQVDGVLQDYLDQLLISATLLPPVMTAKAQAQEQQQAQEPSMPLAPAPIAAPLSRVQSKPSAPSQIPVMEQKIQTLSAPKLQIATTETTVKQQQLSEETCTVASPALPQYTQLTELNWRDSQGIDCLIFKVAGLKLAIPLPLLGGVYPVNDKITPLIGQVAWSLGVWQGEDMKLTLVDTAVLMMPERAVSLKDAGFSFFIQLDRSPWALACQEICDTQTLNYDAIKWRGDTSKRPWLAGTVIEEMCALVDVQGVMMLLEGRRRASLN